LLLLCCRAGSPYPAFAHDCERDDLFFSRRSAEHAEFSESINPWLYARNRARNKQVTAEFEAMNDQIARGLRAWQIALHRSTQFLEAFREVK